MKVNELCNIISPYQEIQVFDSKTGEPVNNMSYLADNRCDVYDSYGDDTIYGIAPKVNKDGIPYLAILVELTV